MIIKIENDIAKIVRGLEIEYDRIKSGFSFTLYSSRNEDRVEHLL